MLPFGVSVVRDCVLVPRLVGWGGELPDSGSTIGDEKQRPGPRLSYHAIGTPPNVAENNNMTIRRIYNKAKHFFNVAENNNMTIRRIYNKAKHFFEMSVLFETGELNAYVYDDGRLYRRKYV